MANSVEIPQDIIDSIIAEVSDDKRSLKQCSLVSSSFLHPSRKHLFSRITLGSDQTCQRIHQLLVQNPVILSFVRIITLDEDIDSSGSEWMNGTSLLAILRLPFCCLECFSFITTWGPRANWNNFTSELKDALSNIIHSSNLKSLSLDDIIKVPITLFLHIVHLTTLELNSILPSDFGYENSSSPTQTASKGVAIASHTVPVIDRLVWCGDSDLEHGEEHHSEFYVRGDTETLFLPFMCRLRFFKIKIVLGEATTHDFNILSFLMGSLCTSLTSPATLEHLEFNIRFRGSNNQFDHDAFYEHLRDADVWTRLDSITSHPTGSRLQRVDININYCFCEDYNVMEPDYNIVLEAVLDSLPLLRTKGILFVEAVVEG